MSTLSYLQTMEAYGIQSIECYRLMAYVVATFAEYVDSKLPAEHSMKTIARTLPVALGLLVAIAILAAAGYIDATVPIYLLS